MTLFRYNQNKLLYIIYLVRNKAGKYYEVHPYKHNTYIGNKRPGVGRPKGVLFKGKMSLSDFEKVAIA